MASFPDNLSENLPPEGLDPFYKALVYLGPVFFFLAAFFAWLTTRKRAKPSSEYRESRIKSSYKDSTKAVTQISFEDSRDMLASLKVEITGAESSISQLGIFKNSGDISDDAYTLLHTQYSTEVTKLTNKMNEMLKADIVSSSTGEIAEGMSDDDMMDIEADLEKQLQGLEDEGDFLAPRTRKRGRIVDAPTPTSVKTTVTEPKHEKVEVVNPPPPTQPVAPPPEKPATSAPPPTKIGEATPVPSTGAPSPSPPPAAIPPPAPSAVPPPPSKPSDPSTELPSSAPQAAQPMKVESSEPEKEKIFAKSTSIAALRMDMLRELARLKKLINEDE
ncbi:MAG: hypothetical protein ACW99Q_19375 [Candidatus Kariarchaeaceae archaeon]|jgi:hypothetical protein